MSEKIDFRDAGDRRDVTHRAVHLLAEGELVVLPTETVYVLAAHALQPAAVRRLRQTVSAALTLGITGPQECLDYVPQMSPLGRKLTRRCWPGPVTLAFEPPSDTGLFKALPAETQEAMLSERWLRFRSPAHEVVQEILQLMPAPLVFSAERFGDESAPVDPGEIAQRFGPAAAVIIDDGPCRYAGPAPVVRISGTQWLLHEPGVIGETTLRRLTSEVYLFVCTGNTCRSPMAEALFRKLLSEKLDCAEDELADRGFVVASAGLAAVSGMPASREGVELLGRRNIDLTAHESQPLTDRLLDQADHILTMTQGHRDSILAARPDLADRVYLLAADRSDISDPIGGSLADYERCSQEIESHIRTLVNQIEFQE